MPRPTLQQARAQYPHRYTAEHVPAWARKPHTHTGGERDGQTLYYAPQFQTDAEWFAHTAFPGEAAHKPYNKRDDSCHTVGQTWPHGQWLSHPFTR